MSQFRRQSRYTWIYVVAVIVGAALLVFSVWLAWRDGIPTWKKGEQPIEVFVVTLTGFFIFLYGVAGAYRAYKEKRSDDRMSSD